LNFSKQAANSRKTFSQRREMKKMFLLGMVLIALCFVAFPNTAAIADTGKALVDTLITAPPVPIPETSSLPWALIGKIALGIIGMFGLSLVVIKKISNRIADLLEAWVAFIEQRTVDNVMVVCKNDSEQKEVFAKLQSEGYICQLIDEDGSLGTVVKKVKELIAPIKSINPLTTLTGTEKITSAIEKENQRGKFRF
jgi:hypothetical protein